MHDVGNQKSERTCISAISLIPVANGQERLAAHGVVGHMIAMDAACLGIKLGAWDGTTSTCCTSRIRSVRLAARGSDRLSCPICNHHRTGQWRKEARLSGKRSGAERPVPSFVPVVLAAPALRAASSEPTSMHAQACGVIEIELAGGRRLRLSGPVDAEALKRVIAVLDGR